MFHSSKRFWLAWLVLIASAQSMFGFALLGPMEPYQVQAIGYGISNAVSLSLGDDGNGTDVAFPKNIGQGYRVNIPTLYYTCDPAFQGFFGSNGVAEIDKAFAMFNNLSNVDSYTPDLSEWPLASMRNNGTAANLGLLDIKSETMSMIIEQLGLAQPDRWTFALHDRHLVGNAVCPNYSYIVDQRNFDPVTQNYSAYVNGTFYGYKVVELCSLNPNTFAPLEADAIEYTTDPTDSQSAVAAYGLTIGGYYTGFTRDDIGGLRYLYGSNNLVIEASDTNSLQLSTNSQPTTLLTSNLNIFESEALTNSTANLLALYPGLEILTTNTSFTLLITTNFQIVITNGGAGSPAGNNELVIVPVLTTNVETLFSYTFGNLIILHSNSVGYLTTTSTEFEFVKEGPAGFGTIVTNLSTRVVSMPTGDFYIIPTNICGPFIGTNGSTDLSKSILLTNIVSITNVIFSTNIVGTTTNIATGLTSAFLSASVITYFTNYTYEVYAVNCVSNSIAKRQGIEKINFVRNDNIDPLTGNYITPFTNTYTLTAVSNAAYTQTFTRIVTRPDFLMTVADLTSGPDANPVVNAETRTALHFDNVNTNQPGPGTITVVPQVVFTYNDVGPVYENLIDFAPSGNPGSQYYIADAQFSPSFAWGSFDGTTNAPIVYPSSASLASLDQQVYFQITSGVLPNASVSTNTVANPYSTQLQASGGSPPYTWTLAANSPGLPPGLSLSSAGIISGVPTTQGTYDFTVQITDFGQIVITKPLILQVGP